MQESLNQLPSLTLTKRSMLQLIKQLKNKNTTYNCLIIHLHNLIAIHKFATSMGRSQRFDERYLMDSVIGGKNSYTLYSIKNLELLSESHPGGFQGITLPLFRAFQVRLVLTQLVQVKVRKVQLGQVRLNQFN